MHAAVYYLSLITPFLQEARSTLRDTDGTNACALTCGRRMFLAALGLAWKYLIDHGRSASFWGTVSGLKPEEIMTNELFFLAKIGWKLYIPRTVSERWKYDF